MLCVPALALAGAWPIAAGLIVGERVGRGIRRPAMSAILASAGKDLGSGQVFGVNEALDQIGGAIGPLMVAFVLSRTGDYHSAFHALLIPALLTLVVLAASTATAPGMAERIQRKPALRPATFPRRYWIYAIGGALFAAGYVDFALIAYHLGYAKIASPAIVSIWYALAMIATAITAPFLGRLLDRVGMIAVAIAIALSAAATPLVFFGHGLLIPFGVALWGIGTAAQDSLFVRLSRT